MSRVVRNWTCSPSASGRRRSRVEPFTRASTACSASLGPIARAASRPVAPSASSSSEESGRTTFIAQVRIDRPRGYFRRMRTGTWVAVAVAPLLLLALLLARPAIDGAWENHPAHFWLVLGAALVATALGFSVTTAARRRRDARLFLISLAFIVSAAFLGLHALATPGVLLGPNAGFELATPVGLLLAAVFCALAAIELRSAQADARPPLGSGAARRPRAYSSPAGRPSRSPSSRRSTTRSRPSSSTAGSCSSQPSASRCSGSPRSASCVSIAGDRSASSSRWRSRSSCSPRRWSSSRGR